jgi:hypothetical protein
MAYGAVALPYLDELRRRGGARRWTQAAGGGGRGKGWLCRRGLVARVCGGDPTVWNGWGPAACDGGLVGTGELVY